MPRRRTSTRSVPDRTLQLRCLCVVRTVSTYGIGGDEEHRRRRRRDVGRDRTPRRRYARAALPDRGRRSALVPLGKTRPSAQGYRASRCADGAPSRSVDGGSDVRSSGSGRTAATSHPALQPGRHGSASTSKLSIQRSSVLTITGPERRPHRLPRAAPRRPRRDVSVRRRAQHRGLLIGPVGRSLGASQYADVRIRRLISVVHAEVEPATMRRRPHIGWSPS